MVCIPYFYSVILVSNQLFSTIHKILPSPSTPTPQLLNDIRIIHLVRYINIILYTSKYNAPYPFIDLLNMKSDDGNNNVKTKNAIKELFV